jgi:tRNA(Ile2) C34 agmatinyltransferase TiaS
MKPSSSEAEQEIVEGVLIPRSLVTSGEVNASELSNELLNLLLKKSASFTVRAVSEHSEVVRRLEEHIEERGMTCRIYTENRGYVAGGAALLTGVGLAAIVGIAAHNVATWNPDYEIARNIVDNKISVTFKKHSKVFTAG